jgi:hypothetical protein
MAMLRALSRRGDEHVVWNTRQDEIGDPEAEAAAHEAECIFRDQKGRALVRIDLIVREAEQIVMLPRVAGGE